MTLSGVEVSKKAVIGLGSLSRRDDAIGIVVLDSLLASQKTKGVDYLNFGSASIDLVSRLKDYDEALLIDAIDAGLAYGKLIISGSEKIEYDLNLPAISSHELNLKDLFELCRRLGVKTKIYLAGIQVKDVSFGEGLSKELENKKREIIKQVALFINHKLLT